MYALGIAIVGGILVGRVLLPLYIRTKLEDSRLIRLSLKASTTLMAVLFCTVGLLRETSEIPGIRLWILFGLIVCMAADVLIELNFTVGVGVFLLGQICYFFYFITLGGFSWLSAVIFILPAIIAGKYFFRFSKSLGKTAPVFFFYGGFILLQFSIAVLLPARAGEAGMLPMIGGIMLVISDYMLAVNTVQKRSVVNDHVYLGFYFLGQYVMAMSVFLPAYL